MTARRIVFRSRTVPRAAWVAVALALLPSNPGEAATIAISTEVSASVTASGLSIALKITNSGDEPARSLVPSVTLAGSTPARVKEATDLGAGQHLDARLDVPWAGNRSGQWPITTVVEYADGNGYPLQAVQVSLLTLGAPTPSLVALIGVEAAPLTTSGRLNVRLKSLSPVAQNVQLRAVGPRSLEIAGPPPFSLAPWADHETTIALTNRGVLPGSRVPVFVVAEYEDQDGHHASLGHRMIEVSQPTAARAVTAPYYAFLAAVALVALWFGVYVWRRRGRAPE
jgi:hypothetical protein